MCVCECGSLSVPRHCQNNHRISSAHAHAYQTNINTPFTSPHFYHRRTYSAPHTRTPPLRPSQQRRTSLLYTATFRVPHSARSATISHREPHHSAVSHAVEQSLNDNTAADVAATTSSSTATAALTNATTAATSSSRSSSRTTSATSLSLHSRFGRKRRQPSSAQQRELAAGSRSMDGPTTMVTCQAPVNIAVIKYCEYDVPRRNHESSVKVRGPLRDSVCLIH